MKTHKIFKLNGGEFLFLSRYGGKLVGDSTAILERCVAHGIDIEEATLALQELIMSQDQMASFGVLDRFICTVRLAS